MPSEELKELLSKTDDIDVEIIFSPYLWIDIITETSFYEELKEFATSQKDPRESLNILRGYEFFLVACLYAFIDAVIRTPRILNLPYDEGLRDTWASIRNRGRDSLTNLIRRNSPVSCVFNSINTHWSNLLKTSSWDELASIRIELSEWAHNLRRGFRYSYRCASSQHRLKKNPESVLHPHAIDWLWPHMIHIGLLSGIYSDIYSRSSNAWIENQVLDDWRENELLPSTRLHEPDKFSFPKRPPDSWTQGFVLTLSKLIEKLDLNNSLDINRLTTNLKGISTWQELTNLGMAMPLDFKASKKIHFIKLKPFPKSALRNLMLFPHRGVNANQLLGIIGAPLQIIEKDGLSAPFNFNRVLEGSISIARKTGEKVRILDLQHKEPYYPIVHSLAIFMPMYTMISNWSSWWVFYDLYWEITPLEDNSSIQARKLVTEILSRFRDDIELESYQISKDDLLSIAEDPGFLYLKEELIKAKNINWDIRGVLPEAIGAEYLGAQDFHPIRMNFKPKFLNGKELDVTAIRWNGSQPEEFYILEFKGSNVSNDVELQQQIDNFEAKISVISKHKKLFANEMKIHLTPNKIKAIFISMADISTQNLKISKQMQVWSFDQFISELRNKQIPTWHLRLLRKSIVATTITFGEEIFNSIFDD